MSKKTETQAAPEAPKATEAPAAAAAEGTVVDAKAAFLAAPAATITAAAVAPVAAAPAPAPFAKELARAEALEAKRAEVMVPTVEKAQPFLRVDH